MADDITHQQLLDAINANSAVIQGIDSNVKYIEGKVQGLETSVKDLDAKVQGIDSKVQGIDTNVKTIEGMLQGVGDSVVGIVDSMVTKDEFLKTENRLNKAFSDEIKQEVEGLEVRLDVRITDLETKLSAKIDNSETRLSRRITSSRDASTKHHLETHKEIGHINHKITGITEGLARASGVQ